MPLLRHVLENATDRPHALLRAKALECISLVGMAVGRARFRDDAARVMQLMQALQARSPPAPAGDAFPRSTACLPQNKTRVVLQTLVCARVINCLHGRYQATVQC